MPDAVLPSMMMSLSSYKSGSQAEHACSYWGEALKWGPQHKLDSAEACCQACQDYRPANDDDMDCNGKLPAGDPAAQHA